MIPLLFLSGSLLSFISSLGCLVIGLMALLLNKHNYQKLSSSLYIGAFSIHAFIVTIAYGNEAAFALYFLTLSVVIIFTSWRSIAKFIVIGLEIIAMITANLIVNSNGPITTLSTNHTIIFTIINVILNIVGVANSSYFYLLLAQKAQADLQKSATTDYLTSLPNRAGFHLFTDKLREVEKTIFQPVAYLLLDVDNFKAVNDK